MLYWKFEVENYGLFWMNWILKMIRIIAECQSVIATFHRNLANHLIWIFAPKLNNILEFLNQISKVSISNHSKEPSLLSNQAHLAAASRSTVDVNDPVQGLVNAPLLSTSAFSNQFKLSSQFQRTSNESHHKNACISGVDTESFFNQFYLFMADPVQSIFSPFRQIFS